MFIGQIAQSGFRAASPQAGVELRQALREAPAVRLERFVEPSMLDAWSRAVEAAPFVTRVHHDAAYWGGPPPTDLVMTDETVRARLVFSFNDPALLEIVQTGADEGAIGSFLGGVSRSGPRAGQLYPWHNDMDGNKLIALSLSLGREPYAGGHLQMRDAHAETILFDDAHATCGDAILFRLSYDLKHRVLDVESGPARTVFVGWFRREPTFADWLRSTR